MKVYRSLSKKEILIPKVLRDFYFGNEKISVQRNLVAYVNEVYLVKAGDKKFILRKSLKAKKLNHLKLEIELLEYLHKKKFNLTPHVIPNKKGESVTIFQNRYYILTNFMPGENKASWNNLEKFTEKRLISYFQASARFTKAVTRFKPRIKPESQTLYYYLKNSRELFDTKVKKLPNNRIKKMLKGNRNFIFNFVKQNKMEFEKSGYDSLPKQLLHFDLHPGNVNYTGDKVTGLFDFDWIRFDNRLADLAGTIGQSCYYFTGSNRGKYNKKRIQLGLQAYRSKYGRSEFGIHQENTLLIYALKAYMFFQFIWCIDWYTNNLTDLKAYGYLDFFIKILKLNDYNRLLQL